MKELDNYQIDIKLTEDAVTIVGDGKLPNIFYVTISSNAFEADLETVIELNGYSISGVIKSFSDESEAIEFAKSIPLQHETYNGEIGSVFVEDRLTGVLMERMSVRDQFSTDVLYTTHIKNNSITSKI